MSLAHGDGTQKILRRAYSFADGMDPKTGSFDAGLLFICFQRSPSKQFIPMQERLAKNDKLNEYIQHRGSALFAILPGAKEGSYIGEFSSIRNHCKGGSKVRMKGHRLLLRIILVHFLILLCLTNPVQGAEKSYDDLFISIGDSLMKVKSGDRQGISENLTTSKLNGIRLRLIVH